MLNRLDISNYALIENVNLKFDKGFTSITGETGAGKSILLKALNLVLGERADTSILKQSEKKCILEAEFDIKNYDLKGFFEANELDYDEFCILRREMSSTGKSRAFINDTPVQVAQLKALGEHLMSIHTQHQTLSILSSDFQMDLVDHFAGHIDLVKNYTKNYNHYRQNVNELIELQVKEKENRKEKDYTTFLLDELEAAELDKLDFEELKSKANKIEYAEKIQTSIKFAQSIFENESIAPSIALKTLIETFDDLKKYDPQFADISARLWSLKIELDDIESEVSNADDIDLFSEEDIVMIREKLESVNSLLFKHNLNEIDELKNLQTSLQKDLEAISSLEERIVALENNINTQKRELHELALKIRKQRLNAIPKLEKEVKNRLSNLAMPNARLKINLVEKEKLTKQGYDQIDFLFNTNVGGEFIPLKKAASGGELSRLMLTVLSILSEKKKLPTLIFDEIDTGVSGEVATKIANEFQSMGKQMQVIAITHLPQVAAKGKQHLHVTKTIKGNKTSTSVVILEPEERIEIVAGMISGEEITAAAKENAENLLTNIF
ncbi:DNA repair protein RecN [Crocinitomix algicola]|uniref:DNA repair protein RecN n=1 Tax=Crocinitomix algicola TaxID=1740263 RepID=UPI00087263B8|nr:DNA repair protein RecN [Crocinitomix algicola]